MAQEPPLQPKRRRRRGPTDAERAEYQRYTRRVFLSRVGVAVAGALGFAAFVFFLFRILDLVSAPPSPKRN